MSVGCALICVGSELLRGKLNTHASHISRRLASVGLSLNEEVTVSDDLAAIAAAIGRGLERFQIILVSGGLGPTFDDLTREAASQMTGRPLNPSKSLLARIQAKFRKAHYRMPSTNARQAQVLEGAEVIDNPVGTAPGQWLPVNDQVLVLLPGPPSELYPMLDSFVLPRLRKFSAGLSHAETHLHFVGVPESVVDAKVRPVISRAPAHAGDHVEFTILAHLGLVDFDVFVSSVSSGRARALLNRIALATRRAVGKAWYGSDQNYPLEKVVGDRFRRGRMTLATAESCTGGLLAARLTEIPGSSDYFKEGWIAYANEAKIRELGVPAVLLKTHGAVSRPAALAMAKGIRERAGTTWGVGITGIAGPSGGTPRKPVGLVYIALASRNRAVCKEFHFPGSRDAVRQRAVLAVLDQLRGV